MTYEDEFKAQTGKVSDKWSSYLSAYENLFSSFRLDPVNILEIGVLKGGHLEVLSRYFPNAKNIIGCDIDPQCGSFVYGDNRIKVIVGNAYTDQTAQKISAIAPELNIVIEDGTHVQRDVVYAFAKYFPSLADGGLFLVEDLHTSYWQSYGGGLFHPFSAYAFFRRLTDVINAEHWNNGLSVEDFMKAQSAYFGIEFPPELILSVHSITFQNSICAIRKAAPGKNALGKRIFAGDSGSQEPFAWPNQDANIFSKPFTDPERRLGSVLASSKTLQSLIGRTIAAFNRRSGN